ncbi:Nodulin-like - like 10 [Theobroma cacao]|nr:Nodulin-like - like 10 [Theobroma cacao]
MMVADHVSGGGCGWREMQRYGLNLIIGRWFMVFASLLIMSVSGAAYMFGLYSNVIKTSMGANSHAFANTKALVTCVKNFPESKGSVLGLLKSYVGMSGVILTRLYHAFYGDNSISFILLIAWLPAAVSFVFLPTIQIIKIARHKNELRVFYNILFISLALAGFLMVLIIIQKRLSFNSIEYVGSDSVVTILLFFPLTVVIREDFKIWRRKKQALDDVS